MATVLTAIYAQTRDGYMADSEGRIPWPFKGPTSEMAFFREVTKGCVLIMGGTTYAQITKHTPGLKDRAACVVLTRGAAVKADRGEWPGPIHFAFTPLSALNLAVGYGKLVYVVGGPKCFGAMGKWTGRVVRSTVNAEKPAGNDEWLKAPTDADWQAWTGGQIAEAVVHRWHEPPAVAVQTWPRRPLMDGVPPGGFVTEVSVIGKTAPEVRAYRDWLGQQKAKK